MRNVFELLKMWGEWERNGSGFLKHLQAKSPTAICMASVLACGQSCAAGMSDDEALAFGGLLLQLKRLRRQQYEILFLVHVRNCSMREVALMLRISRIEAPKIYERALGWLEGNLDSRVAA
jgi:hypothetical protein